MKDDQLPIRVPPLKVVFSEEDVSEITRRIKKCLRRGQVAQGENVQEFEEAFAQFVGVKHAVALSSGGAAIEVAMRLFGVKDRDVLVPTNTFAATATGVLLAGGRVRFVDAEERFFAVSLETLKRSLTPQTVGVILVHIGGIVSPEIEGIQRWCEDQGLWLFEDAAHAHGSSLNGRKAGQFGRAAAFSFFATKVITSGEGGMLVTDDEDLAKKARGLRDYGKPDPWVSFHTEIGSNWRMSEFCAAVGLVHLRRLEEFIAWRQRIANLYTRSLKEIPELTLVLPVDKSSWYKYIVLLPGGINRQRLKERMKQRGISLSGGVYDIPLHRQPAFERMLKGSFPVADDIASRHICLPIYSGMTEEEAEYVVEVLRSTLEEEKVHA